MTDPLTHEARAREVRAAIHVGLPDSWLSLPGALEVVERLAARVENIYARALATVERETWEAAINLCIAKGVSSHVISVLRARAALAPGGPTREKGACDPFLCTDSRHFCPAHERHFCQPCTIPSMRQKEDT